MSTNEMSAPDLLDLAKAEKYDEIENLLDDSSLNQNAKVEMILMKYTHDWSLFQDICSNPKVPLDLVLKVLRIVGTNMIDISCRGSLEQILKVPITEERSVNVKRRIIRVMMNELEGDEYIDLKAHLLAVAVIHGSTKKEMRAILQQQDGGKELLCKKHRIAVTYSNKTKQTVNVEMIKNAEVETKKSDSKNTMIVEATALEIALHSHSGLDIIGLFLGRGGKELTSKSKRSLLQGVLLEYNKHIAVDIFQAVLSKSDRKDVVVNMNSWNEQILDDMGIFQFLNFKKNFLREPVPIDNNKKKKDKKKKVLSNRQQKKRKIAEKRKVLSFDDMKQIMNSLLDAQGDRLISMRYGSSGSILHTFDYYDHLKFTSIVSRILKVGGQNLLDIRDDDGNNFLQHLVASNKDVLSSYWYILTINKEFVMETNMNMETALHIACRMNRVDCIDALLKRGEADITKARDKDGNTALHLLSGVDALASEILEKIIAVGGRQLLTIKNKANEVPSNPLASKYPDEAVLLMQQKKRIEEEPVVASKYGKRSVMKKLQDATADYTSLKKCFDEQKKYIAMLEDKKQKDDALFFESAKKVQQLEEENAKLQSSLISQQNVSQKDIATTPSRKRPRDELESDVRSPKSPFRKFTSKVSSMLQRKEEIENGDTEETESKDIFEQIAALQSENEDLLIQLENEKTNHTRTLQRLKDSRDTVWHN